MTPKEKARQLVEKYDLTLTYLESKSKAKQCALIAVEQIETITKHYPPDYMLTVYWQQVKQEIEKL